MKKIVIGVTDCGTFDRYAKWIAGDSNIEIVKLSYKHNSFSEIEKCHGILLTGGEDVNPKFYNMHEYMEYCDKDDMDDKRDAFELKVLQYVKDNSLPLLGICRGLQITNVFFGGTLIPDIPTFGKFNHSKVEGYDLYHSVAVDPNSLLSKITGTNKGEINSAHHQSTAKVGKDLIANSISTDGIIEGLEWKHPKGKSFLLLVQWHPERMKDQQSDFTKNIRISFVEAIGKIIQ